MQRIIGFNTKYRTSDVAENLGKYLSGKIFPTGNRRNRALFTGQKKTKFWLPLKLSLLCGSRPKYARTSPQRLAHTVPYFIRIGSLTAEL